MVPPRAVNHIAPIGPIIPAVSGPALTQKVKVAMNNRTGLNSVTYA
jgi:hypothetical protein